jgi:hypothetical protein
MLKRLMGVAVVACLLAVPAVAGAVTPKKNSHFAYCTSKNNCPLSFDTAKNGKSVKNFTFYNKCSSVPVLLPAIKIKSGRFKFSGTRKNVIGKEIQVKISGRFVTPKKAKGSVTYTRSDCSANAVKFTAKRVGKAGA